MPRHTSFLLKIKITMFSLSLSDWRRGCAHPCKLHFLFASALSVPHSVSQSACVIRLYILFYYTSLLARWQDISSYRLPCVVCTTVTACFNKCKQLFEYHYLHLLRDVWWSKFSSIFICPSFSQHQTSVAA